MPDTLVLFDIDGTLLDTGGAGIVALREGFAQAFPEKAARMPALDLAGATDNGLVMNIFRHAEIEHNDSNREQFYQAYLTHLAEKLPDFPGGLLPGITELLSALTEQENTTLGLLTGNLQRGARVKVDHFGVGQHFHFGSYGDDHHDRNQLGPIAISRAEQSTGNKFPPESVYVLGDTAKDINCARAAGVQAIAVATGSISRGDLESHAPDALFDDFTDTHAVLQAMELTV